MSAIGKAIRYLSHEDSSIVEASLRILINFAFEGSFVLLRFKF